MRLTGFVCTTSLLVLLCIGGVNAQSQEIRILDQLNRRETSLGVGQIVVLRDDSIHAVVNVMNSQPLGMPTGWTTTRVEDKFGLSHLGTEYFLDVCGQPSYFCATSLMPNDVTITLLSDPFKTLEVFNRPLTGLANNSEAEMRIQQWRATLNRSISDTKEVYLVVEVVTSKSPHLKVRGNLADKSLTESLTRVLNGSDLKVKPESVIWSYDGPYRIGDLALSDPLVISVKLRKLDRVTESLPQLMQIGFSFNGDRVLGWQASPSQPVIGAVGLKANPPLPETRAAVVEPEAARWSGLTTRIGRQ